MILKVYTLIALVVTLYTLWYIHNNEHDNYAVALWIGLCWPALIVMLIKGRYS